MDRTFRAGFHRLQTGLATKDREANPYPRAFADAVIERLGQKPDWLKAAGYTSADVRPISIAEPKPRVQISKEMVGVDLFVEWDGRDANQLAERLQSVSGTKLELQMITNRAVKVWPHGLPQTFKVDHWRCRFLAKGDANRHPPRNRRADDARRR